MNDLKNHSPANSLANAATKHNLSPIIVHKLLATIWSVCFAYRRMVRYLHYTCATQCKKQNSLPCKGRSPTSNSCIPIRCIPLLLHLSICFGSLTLSKVTMVFKTLVFSALFKILSNFPESQKRIDNSAAKEKRIFTYGASLK